MRKLFLLMVALALAILALPFLAVAQQTARTVPTIVAFAVEVDRRLPADPQATPEPQPAPVTVNAVEDGEVSAVFSWRIVGWDSQQHRLALHVRQLNQWQLLAENLEAPTGRTTLDVPHSLTFEPPTLRLSLLDSAGQPLTERYAIIPYRLPDDLPTIHTFTAQQAADGSTTVQWEVLNRVPTANLIFEQVMPDASTVSIERPRDNLWIPSRGQGPVAPQGSGLIRLRLSVVDVVDGRLYAQQEANLTVTQSPGS